MPVAAWLWAFWLPLWHLLKPDLFLKLLVQRWSRWHRWRDGSRDTTHINMEILNIAGFPIVYSSFYVLTSYSCCSSEVTKAQATSYTDKLYSRFTILIYSRYIYSMFELSSIFTLMMMLHSLTLSVVRLNEHSHIQCGGFFRLLPSSGVTPSVTCWFYTGCLS